MVRGAGSRAVASHGLHLLHFRPPATRDIQGTRSVRRRSRRQWGRAWVRGLWRHEAFIPCMFAQLQQKTSQARKASDEGAGASAAGRGFEACGVTRRPSAACSLHCNTRHCRHVRRQMKGPAPAGQGAGSRPVGSRGLHLLHVGKPATRGTARTPGVSQWSQRQRERARVRGLWLHEVYIPCMFALLQHETSQAHERRQMHEPAPVGQGADSRPVASRGVHPLHVRIPATRDVAGTRGVR